MTPEQITELRDAEFALADAEADLSALMHDERASADDFRAAVYLVRLSRAIIEALRRPADLTGTPIDRDAGSNVIPFPLDRRLH